MVTGLDAEGRLLHLAEITSIPVSAATGSYSYSRTVYRTASGITAPASVSFNEARNGCKGCGAPWTPSERCEYCRRYR